MRVNFLIFCLLFLSAFSLAGGIKNKESAISPMTKTIVAAIAAQQKIFEKGVDNYQKKLIEKQLVILGRIKMVSGVKTLVLRSYFENQSSLHSLRGITDLLSLRLSIMGISGNRADKSSQ